MTGYVPDRWTIVSILDDAGIWFDKVFGTWSGGYLHGSSWRLNSGIVSHEIEGDVSRSMGSLGASTGVIVTPMVWLGRRTMVSWIVLKLNIQTAFGSLMKRRPCSNTVPPFEGPRYPSRSEAAGWMIELVDHYSRYRPDELYRLFTPSSGDYIPLKVHVGSCWTDEAQRVYRRLKQDHPDAVERAREETEGLPGRVSLSRVAIPLVPILLIGEGIDRVQQVLADRYGALKDGKATGRTSGAAARAAAQGIGLHRQAGGASALRLK